jgi:chromosome segregation protein
MENQRLLHVRETTDIKVELAKCEERLRNLDTQLRQLEENRLERQRTVAENREQLAQSRKRAEASEWNILRVESEIAELYLRKENFASQTVGLIENRESLQSQRTAIGSEAQNIRTKIRKLEDKIHAQDLAAGEIRHERGSLADRLREDYGIELSELEHDPSIEEQHQREAVQQEIDDLRRKLNNLGNVNLEALEELEQLDTRFNTLSEQYRDLSDAKNSLEKIIDKINTDSRRLFAETLDTVRGHFQQLFRDLFGGGSADIVLEENVDILDSGIEIVARPPGKEPRNISLLSGGEKTLTCVALLLAIFRSRPSPFCVLDEVDAALDEANIDRFTKVMQDFLTWTQFIIVTHSKKTMTCANSIYGVTMQESGVSKQVSVCFEDVSEDGQILTNRSKAAKNEDAA